MHNLLSQAIQSRCIAPSFHLSTVALPGSSRSASEEVLSTVEGLLVLLKDESLVCADLRRAAKESSRLLENSILPPSRVPDLITVFDSHGRSPLIMERSCEALTFALEGNPTDTDRVNVVPYVLSVMVTHVARPEVVVAAARALRASCADDAADRYHKSCSGSTAAACAFASVLGGAESLVNALRLHVEDAAVVEAICDAMQQLVSHQLQGDVSWEIRRCVGPAASAAGALVAAGAAPAIIACFCKPSSARSTRAALSVLSGLLNFDVGSSVLARLGNVLAPALISVALTHNRSAPSRVPGDITRLV